MCIKTEMNRNHIGKGANDMHLHEQNKVKFEYGYFPLNYNNLKQFKLD